MEIPIYEDFQTFEKNYLIDFSKIQDTSYFEYLNHIEMKYKEREKEFEEMQESITKEIETIFDRLSEPIRVMENEFSNGTISNLLVTLSESEKKDFLIKNISKLNECLLDKYSLQNLDDLYKKKDLLNENSAKWYSYDTEKTAILVFIAGEKEKEKINLLRYQGNQNSISNELPEIQHEETPEEKNAKVKFILLKELGIIDFLITQNFSNADIGKILKPITGIKESYTANILTADFKTPNIETDKTAYKKKNIIRAVNELDKMNIGLEQCKYLPNLKNSNPELFE